MESQSISDRAGCVGYPCPHCRAELETRDDDGWSGWRRCPACDRPHLPPDPSEHAPPSSQSADPSPEEVFRIGTVKELRGIEPMVDGRPAPLWTLRQFEPVGRSHRSRQSRWYRRGLMIGLGISLFAVLFAFLEQGDIAVGGFALLSMVFFLLLMRPPRKG